MNLFLTAGKNGKSHIMETKAKMYRYVVRVLRETRYSKHNLHDCLLDLTVSSGFGP